MLSEILKQEMEDISIRELNCVSGLTETLAAGCGALAACGGCSVKD